MSYTDYTTSEYARQIDEAHTKVLERFQVGKLNEALQDKLQELSLIPNKKVYGWITSVIPRKDGSVLLGAGIEEAKRTGYYEYFETDENDEFSLTYNRHDYYWIESLACFSNAYSNTKGDNSII
jgi:hypothetical protein